MAKKRTASANGKFAILRFFLHSGDLMSEAEWYMEKHPDLFPEH